MVNAEPFTDIDAAIDNLVEAFKQNVKYQSKKFPAWNGYIQRYHKKPHAVMLCSPDQIRYGGLCDTLYIDATGQMVHSRKEDDKIKQVLLHSVVGLPSGITNIKITPVVEFLSTAGTANEIEIMLKAYCSEVKKVKPSWKPRLVVSDFCLAYLHGNSEAFCGMSLDKYINSKYDVLVNEEAIPDKESTTLFVCSGHFLHFNARYLRSHNVNKEQNSTALFMFASLINANKVAEYKEVISDAVSLFGSKTFPAEERDRIVAKFKRQEMFDADSFIEDYDATHKSDIRMEDIFPEKDAKLQQDKSKFHVYFEKRAEEIIKSTTLLAEANTLPRNPYYSPVIVKTLRRWNVYLPLWSKVAFAKHKNVPSESITTARVEQYFGQLKTSFHTSRNVREDIFIKIQSSMAQNMVTDALAKGLISKRVSRPRAAKAQITQPKPNQAPPKTKRDNGVGNPAYATAKWGKKKSKDPRYLQRTPAPTQIQPSNSATTANSSLSGNEVLMEEYKDLIPTYRSDKTLLDPLFISDRWWVKESRLVPNLVICSEEFPGDESDVLTLRPSLLVSSSIAERMSRIIVDSVNCENTYVIGPTLIEQSGDDVRSNITKLPDIAHDQLHMAKLYMISMMQSHAWLTQIDIGKRVISYYDSAPGLVKDAERVLYYNEVENSLHAVYGIQQGLTYVCKNMSLQLGNECVQMALLALKACLLGKDPEAAVSPHYARVFRHEILRSILPETLAGSKLLIAAEGKPNVVLDLLQKRETERQFVTSVLRRRNGIANAFAKFKKDANNPSEYPQSVLAATKSLADDIANHELNLKVETFMKSSEIQPELSETAEISQEELVDPGFPEQQGKGLDTTATNSGEKDFQQEVNVTQEAQTEESTNNPGDLIGEFDEDEETPEAFAEKVASTPTSVLMRSFSAIMGGIQKLSGEKADGNKPKSKSEIIFEEMTKRKTRNKGHFVQDFLEKQKIVTLHRRKIEELSDDDISKFIDEHLEQLQAISKGTCHCWRSEIFEMKTSDSEKKLRASQVSEPFTCEQAAYVYNQIVDKMYNSEHKIETFNFIMKVMIPETLIRIYASANEVTYSTAKIEIDEGFYYDGPVLEQ